MQLIDNLLNRITMYRLVLYELIAYLGIAIIFSFFGFLHLNPLSIFFSSIFLVAVCLFTNEVFARVFSVSANEESAYITALILACIFSPLRGIQDLPVLGFAGILAMASKYIFAINKKHIFNPVAIAAVLITFGLNSSASWWLGNLQMAPFVIICGYLIVRKIQRGDLVLSFLITTLSIVVGATLFTGKNLEPILNEALFHSPLFFFSTVMLTEPLTTPPTKKLRVIYGILVGILFSPEVHVGTFYFAPELALVLGNVFSFLVSPKYKLNLHLSQKIQIGPDSFNFIFKPNKKVNFAPGQYMEWTLRHSKIDSRGNRRYFTIASSPTEDSLTLGIKFYPNGSSFKKAMLSMTEKDLITAGNLAGDFTLPSDESKKLVFIAGGIGITPFRSMIKYLIDKQEKRDIVIMFSNKSFSDIVYADILSEAQNMLGIKNVCTITDQRALPENWKGKVGRIDTKMIEEEIPEYEERTYYLSGPQKMVKGFENTLKGMGIAGRQIKKDFFPGYN